MQPQGNILVVDDDAEIRSLVAEYLTQHGYRVSTARDGTAMRRAIESERPDLVVLDLMLPGEDGLSLCRDLRAKSNLPVIMLTARREEIDRIIGIEMGADDYLGKPFNPRELLARIQQRAAARARTARIRRPGQAAALRGLDAGLHRAPPGRSAGRHRAAERRPVPPSRDLPAPSRARARPRRLVDLTLGREAMPFDRSIDVQVSRLRQLLRDSGREPRIIKTVRNGGYVLATAVERLDG